MRVGCVPGLLLTLCLETMSSDEAIKLAAVANIIEHSKQLPSTVLLAVLLLHPEPFWVSTSFPVFPQHHLPIDIP